MLFAKRVAFTLVLAAAGTPLACAQHTKQAKTQPIAGASAAQERWVARTVKHLTLEEKIGQMIEVRGIMGYYNAEDPVFQQLIGDIRKYHLGAVHLSVNTDGPLLLRTEPYEAAMTTNLLQQESRQKVPLIFSVDFERGPSMRLSAIEAFPQSMAFGATHNPAYVEQFARIPRRSPARSVSIGTSTRLRTFRSILRTPSLIPARLAKILRRSRPWLPLISAARMKAAC